MEDDVLTSICKHGRSVAAGCAFCMGLTVAAPIADAYEFFANDVEPQRTAYTTSTASSSFSGSVSAGPLLVFMPEGEAIEIGGLIEADQQIRRTAGWIEPRASLERDHLAEVVARTGWTRAIVAVEPTDPTSGSRLGPDVLVGRR